MAFAGISYLGAFLAAVAAWVFGAVYYGLLGSAWMAAAGLTKERIGRPSPVPFILSFLAAVVMAIVLAGVIGHLGPGQVTIRNGMLSALFLWGGFVATTILVNNAYQLRPYRLSLIDAGHWLGAMLIMGAVIGWWGV